MRLAIFLISILVFLETFLYGIVEMKQNPEKKVGITILFLSFVCLIVPSIIIQFR